jgi:alanine-alpha-ketoisovalerate/valine-pyruvate aminotransferase
MFSPQRHKDRRGGDFILSAERAKNKSGIPVIISNGFSAPFAPLRWTINFSETRGHFPNTTEI